MNLVTAGLLAGVLAVAPLVAAASEGAPRAGAPQREQAFQAAAKPAPLRILRIPDDFTLPGVRKLVSDAVESVQADLGPVQGRIRFYVGGHGRASSAEDTLENARLMAQASGAQAIVVFDFPELRIFEVARWHWAVHLASRKAAAAIAALNGDPRSMVWSMRGESAMAEIIVLMYDVAPRELKPFIRVARNVVMDSYPWARAPFLPREIPAGFLGQVGGRVYVNFTKFGHWSNPLTGGPRLVNVCVAPHGEPVAHGYYEVVEATRILEQLEISGAPIEAVLDYAERIGSCAYLSNMLDDLRRRELPGRSLPIVAPITDPN